MNRKNHNWEVTFNNKTVEVVAKTYGSACRKAFKAFKLQAPGVKQTQPQSDYETGGFVGVEAKLLT